MDMDKNKIDCIHVAVIGGAHHNTLGVIRSLGEQGIKKENNTCAPNRRPYYK